VLRYVGDVIENMTQHVVGAFHHLIRRYAGLEPNYKGTEEQWGYFMAIGA
jgi:hypothetical protein